MVSFSHPKTFLIDMPTADQMRTLFKVVGIAHPKLLPEFATDADRSEFYASFTQAFGTVASWRRIDLSTVNLQSAKYRCDTWTDSLNAWLQQRGEPAQVTARAFMMAVIAAGDCDYIIERWPYDAFVGLSFDSGARAPTASWKTVLTTRQTRSPIRLRGPGRAQPQRVVG